MTAASSHLQFQASPLATSSTFAASVEDFAKQESERERDIYLAARDRREPHPNHVPAISDAKLQANGFVPQELVAVCEVIPVSESDHAHPLGTGRELGGFHIGSCEDKLS